MYKFKFILRIKNIFRFSLYFSIIIAFVGVLFYKKKNNDKYPSKYESLKIMKSFMRDCVNGNIINNNILTYNSSLEIKISVVIPLYNCEDSIKYAIKSIQNQDMREIEIILVNDFSTDETLNIIEELSKEDPRIKIINNQRNMGTLYSRNIGILQSIGKYIMNLDNDDLFMAKDVFDVIFQEIEATKYDIIGFRAIEGPNYNPKISQLNDGFFHNFPDELTIFQPDLRYFPYSRNDEWYPNDFHVWGRIVKSNIYKNAINDLGKNSIGQDRKKQFLTWCEDLAISIVLFKFAQSYKFIKKYVIFHFMSKKTTSNTTPKVEKIYGDIFVLDLMFDYSENETRRKNYVAQFALKEGKKTSYWLTVNRTAPYLKIMHNKILNCEYISESYKNQLRSYINNTDN